MGKDNRARRKRKLAQKVVQKKHRREKARAQGRGRTLAPTFHVFRNPFEGLRVRPESLVV